LTAFSGSGSFFVRSDGSFQETPRRAEGSKDGEDLSDLQIPSGYQEGAGAMVTMTRTAAEKVQDFIQEHGVESGAGLRVAVLPGGCSGFQYGLNIEDAPESDDEVLEVDGVKVFVDPFSAQYLDGVEIDYVTSFMGQGFTFRNPNASGGCGCGSSFTV
jgi:iron-sulfur cluster assembly protein